MTIEERRHAEIKKKVIIDRLRREEMLSNSLPEYNTNTRSMSGTLQDTDEFW